MQTLTRITAWFFVVGLGINLGAGFYESVVVVPLWSRGVPATLAEGNPFAEVAIRAGVRFWSVVTPAVALLAVAALVLGLRSAPPAGRWLVFAAVAELLAAAATFFYFRAALVNLFLTHGAGLTSDAIVSIVQRWVGLNWLRVAVTVVAWCGALRAAVLI